MQLIEELNGNDPRFYHRQGGQPFQNDSWIDRFSEPNQNLAVCGLGQPLSLSAGIYRLDWDCQLNFKSPECRRPDKNYPVVLSLVFGQGVDKNVATTSISQVTACAERDELIYNKGISTDFRILGNNGSVFIEISAYDDTRTSEPTSINVEEVIVRKMSLYQVESLTKDNLYTIDSIKS